MNSTIKYLENEGVVTVRTSDVYKVEEELGTVFKAASLLKEYNCNKCLFDLSAATIVVNPLIAFNRSKDYESVGLGRSVKLAVLVQELTENLRLYENVTVNRGWSIKVFTEFDTAMAWLKQ